MPTQFENQMVFFPCNMILQFAILVVFITSKSLFLALETPRLSLSTDKEALISFKSGIHMETLDPLFASDQALSPCNGSFGSVYKGYLQQGKTVAIKVLNSDTTGSWKSFLAECAALRNVRHRNLVKLITACSSMDFKNMNFLALVYELMTNGSLDDWIIGKRSHADGQGLNIVDRLNVAIDVACVLDYLHHENGAQVMVHCDLKPSNILLDGDMTAKVGDFGLAKLLINRATDNTSINSTNALKGSIGYIPPEKPPTVGDVYSYGITLLELFTGRRPTRESFTGDLSLKKWVQMAFEINLDQVLDPGLVPTNRSFSYNGQSIAPESQRDCLIAILGVGLSCTVDSPYERVRMRDAPCKLKSIRETLLKT